MRQVGIEHVNQHVVDPDGRLAVIHGEPLPTSGAAGANVGETVSCTTYGMSSVTAYFTGAAAPTFAFESSFDSGSTWTAMQMYQAASLTLGTTLLAIPGQNWEGGVPAGATNVRARCTIASGAGLTVTLLPSAAIYRTSQLVQFPGGVIPLGTSTARIGTVGSQTQAISTTETTTPLAGAGSVTSTAYDLTLITSGNPVVGITAGFNEFRALAVSDATGTLHIEVSSDQVTWWRISSTATAALGSIFDVQVSLKPVTRYARAVYVNGAVAQTSFLLSTARFD